MGAMSHNVKGIRLEVYDFSLASTGGPGTGTVVPYSPSGPHLLRYHIVRPSTPKKRQTMSRSLCRPLQKMDGLNGWEHCLILPLFGW